jgi:hypothetical protein
VSRDEPPKCARRVGPGIRGPTEVALFGQFVGEWRVRNALFSESTGTWRESDLLWTFDWIIAGRGIQGVLVDSTGSALGTTVRPGTPSPGGVSCWFCPRASEHVVLAAIDHGGQITLDGKQADLRRVKWIFSDIGPDSFTWNGWCSNDDGETWWHEQHMDAHRSVR